MSFSQENVSVAINRDKSLVVIAFDRDVGYIELIPDQATAIAESITTCAFEADTNLKPVGDTLKAALVERHRDKLIPRISLMLGSLREDQLKSNGQIAVLILDAVFSEVFS